MSHFNWLQLIPGVGHEYVHIATAILTSLVIAVFCLAAFVSLKAQKGSLAPAGRFSIRGVAEVFVEFIIGLSDTFVGKKHRNLVPFFGGLFIYVLFNNLMGLIPGITPATDNINTNIAIGAFAFVSYNFLGFKENGIGYLKHFAGPVLWLAPLMVAVEVISHLVRPFSLSLRLMGNLKGDHAVLGALTDMVPALIPVPFYALGLFVCCIQAYVFTLLTMVYVSMATAHDH